MSSKDKENQRLSANDREARKPISSKQAKKARKEKKLAKEARK